MKEMKKAWGEKPGVDRGKNVTACIIDSLENYATFMLTDFDSFYQTSNSKNLKLVGIKVFN